MPHLPIDVLDHLAGLSQSFTGEPVPLTVEFDGLEDRREVPALTGEADEGEYTMHAWQLDGTQTGRFLGIEADGSDSSVSFNGVTIKLPDGRWMTFIDTGYIMAQLGVTFGRSVVRPPQPA